MPIHPRSIAAALALAFTATGVLAHDPVQHADPSAPSLPEEVPLYDNLGRLSYPISSESELARRYFDQGLRLSYAFNHGEALRAYRAAQHHDPECALCYWGEAYVLGPNINAPMDEGAGSPAVTAVRRAQALAAAASPREQALIAALAERYSDETGADQAELNRAFAEGMARAHRAFPEDDEIAVLYVDALMNLSPWDYWEADGSTPKGRVGEAVAVAEQVLARNPEHPGAIHLYIHLTEASQRPERAEPYADRLADLMPGAGHLVHMASHTYYRIGRYEDSARINQRAVAVDEAYLAGGGAAAEIYAHGLYPHNIHFVVSSSQMSGDAETALAYAERLAGKIPDPVAEQVGWIQAILPAPYFAHAQFSATEAILALPDPGERFPLVRAMWHYARGVALAEQGKLEAARGESARIAELNGSGDFEMLLAWGVPAPDLLRIARHVVEARIAEGEENLERAIAELQVAVQIQDALAYMEPPFWYYPVRQSLGAALLQAGRVEEAASVFQAALEEAPNSPALLFGLREAQRAGGDAAAARETDGRLRQAMGSLTPELDLRRM